MPCVNSECPTRPPLLDVTDPNGLNDPRATWNIVNGAAGHYDGLGTLDFIPEYAAKAIDE